MIGFLLRYSICNWDWECFWWWLGFVLFGFGLFYILCFDFGLWLLWLFLHYLLALFYGNLGEVLVVVL